MLTEQTRRARVFDTLAKRLYEDDISGKLYLSWFFLLRSVYKKTSPGRWPTMFSFENTFLLMATQIVRPIFAMFA